MPSGLCLYWTWAAHVLSPVSVIRERAATLSHSASTFLVYRRQRSIYPISPGDPDAGDPTVPSPRLMHDLDAPICTGFMVLLECPDLGTMLSGQGAHCTPHARNVFEIYIRSFDIIIDNDTADGGIGKGSGNVYAAYCSERGRGERPARCTRHAHVGARATSIA